MIHIYCTDTRRLPLKHTSTAVSSFLGWGSLQVVIHVFFWSDQYRSVSICRKTQTISVSLQNHNSLAILLPKKNIIQTSHRIEHANADYWCWYSPDFSGMGIPTNTGCPVKQHNKVSFLSSFLRQHRTITWESKMFLCSVVCAKR